MKAFCKKVTSPGHSKKTTEAKAKPGQLKNENGDPEITGRKKLKTEASPSKTPDCEADTSANPVIKKMKTEDSAPENPGREEIRAEAAASANSVSEEVRTEAPVSTTPGHEEARTEDPVSSNSEVRTEAPVSLNPVSEEARTEASASTNAVCEKARSDAPVSANIVIEEARTEALVSINSAHEELRREAPIPANPGHEEVRDEGSASGNQGHEEASSEDSGNPGQNGREDSTSPGQNGREDSSSPGQNGREDSASPAQDNNEQEDSTNQGQGSEEPPSPEMEILMLEAALERLDQQHKVQGVLKITKEQAVPRGENFLSSVTRQTVEVVLGSGRRATRRFILKEMPKETLTRNVCKNSGIFKLEINTYKIVLKEMEYLMAECGDTDDVLWCQLIKYEPYNSILLEDLTDFGFRTVRRQSCLDFDHGVIAIRNIARFHAMSKVLQDRGIINPLDTQPYSLIGDKNTVKSFFYKGYEAVSEGIKKYWGREWFELADKLRLPLEYLLEKMLGIGLDIENRFCVLNHGDCWSNNLMFKYDWRNKPIAVRFLDFQAPHYNTPAIDLTYFLHQSMVPVVRRTRFVELLEHYYESLLRSFDKYKYSGPRPSFDDILNEMERVSFFGLSMFAIRHAVVTTDMEDAMDLERILVTEGEEGLNIDIFRDLSLIERMVPDLRLIVNLHAR
nr:uncharacterized protein LOC106682286 isoform X4 [Halyomorpha halys]